MTREILWNVPAWAQVVMYALFVAAVAALGVGMASRVARWRRGRAGGLASARSMALAFWRDAVLQVRIHRSSLAGWSHAGIVWGFVVLFIGTCIVLLEEYGSAWFGRTPLFFYGGFYLAVSFALDVFGVLFLGGVLLALFRRRGDARRPPLDRPIDRAVLGLLFVIGFSGFLLEGARIAAAHGGPEANEFERWSFVGWTVAHSMASLSDETVRTVHLSLWLGHMAISMAFIALLPYCKLRHVLIAPLHVAIHAGRPRGRVAVASLEEFETTERYGVESAAEFSRGTLVSFDACTECARCQVACPAHATQKPLSPMRVVLDCARAPLDARLAGDRIAVDALWACTTCGACVEECPVVIDQLATISDLRRFLVGQGEVHGGAQSALRALGTTGNPWGLPEAERADWAAESGAIIVPGRVTGGVSSDGPSGERELEILYWVGCAASYDPSAQKVARAMVAILESAGVSFAILGKAERCTGDPARQLGDDFTFLELAEGNIEAIRSSGAKRIVATCPHCFHSLSNDYADLGASFDVVHHTQLIRELIREGRLDLESGDATSVAIHDACYLARRNGEVDAPRAGLRASGVATMEPEFHGRETFCCGGGGGRMWMDEETEPRVSEARFDQLSATGAESVAVSCPFCRTMLSDEAARRDLDVPVVDVAEVVASRLRGRGIGAAERRSTT